jgi:hypothetical protein
MENLVVSKINFIRDKRVMLDRDLAELYEVETKVVTSSWGGTRKIPYAFTEHRVGIYLSRRTHRKTRESSPKKRIGYKLPLVRLSMM